MHVTHIHSSLSLFFYSSNDVDVIVWSLFSHGYNQCSDDPMGTYITPVPTFVQAYINQLESNNQDYGYDDYVAPDAAQYIDCTYVQIQNQEYYVQLGCTDGTSQSISVNIYTDNTCETKSTVGGYDDANIDVSEIQVRDYTVWIGMEVVIRDNSPPTHSTLYHTHKHSYRLSNARLV